VGVSELMRGKASPHACPGGSPAQLSALSGVGAVPAARWSGDDAKQRPDWELEPRLKPWLQLFPAPRVHTDPAAPSSFTVADKQRSASRIEIGLAERERLLSAWGCSLCAAACPADCIRVVAAENTPENRVSAGESYATVYEINLSRCI